MIFINIITTQAQITSYPDGGAWHKDTTWIGGVVPGASDNVEIDGPVKLWDNEECLDLTITSSGTLNNEHGGNGLYVFGDIENHGVIALSSNLDVEGNINNHGTWEANDTRFQGSGQQEINILPSKVFSGAFINYNDTDTLIATSDLQFTGNFILNDNILNLNDYDIRFTGPDYRFGYGTVVSPGEFLGTVNLDNTIIKGNLVVTDTLQNRDDLTRDVSINGNLTNNGIIQNNTSDYLYLNVTGDITNNGTWQNYLTRFEGTGPQHITLQAGKIFDCDFENNNTTDTLIANSYLHMTGDFRLNDNILNLNDYNIRFTGPDYWFGNGTLVSPGEFLGTVNMYHSTNIEGHLVVTDTLQNNNSNSTVSINGNLTNNGIIQNNSSYDLNLSVTGDMTNDGNWDNELTTFNGTEDQRIRLTSDKLNTGEVRFESYNVGSPYQWYYNSAILNSSYFTGENSSMLVWQGPITDNWYGTFHCQTSARDSRDIIVSGGEFSFNFDGSDAYVNCGKDASLNFTSNISLEAWINPAGWGEQVDYGFGRIIDKKKFKLFLNDAPDLYNEHSLVFILQVDGSSHLMNTPSNSISLDQWQHVAATYDGDGGVHVFINGIDQVLTGTPPSGDIDDHSMYDLLIGENDNLSRAFDGDIDEVRYWNSVLESTSIRENMYREITGSETGLVSYWKFNEDTGNIAYDFAGSNNGTIYNIPGGDRVIATTPVPYYTISDGNWESDTVWAIGQNAPEYDWTRANISDSVEISSNLELIELTLDQQSYVKVNSGYQLNVAGSENGGGSGSGAYVNTNRPPNPPNKPNVIDLETDGSTKVELQWSCYDPDGDPLRYDVYVGTYNPPTTMVADDQTEDSYVTSCSNNATVYWKVVVFDNNGNSTTGPVWNFKVKHVK